MNPKLNKTTNEKTYTRISEIKKEKIRKYYLATGRSYKEISHKFEITLSHVSKALKDINCNIKSNRTEYGKIIKRKPTKLEIKLFRYFDEFVYLYKKTIFFSSTKELLNVFNIRTTKIKGRGVEISSKKNNKYKTIFQRWLKNHNEKGYYKEIIE